MFVRSIITVRGISSSTRKLVKSNKFLSALPFSTGVETEVVSENTDTPTWCVLTGFSPFVNRFDLQFTLGSFQPLKIDPILNYDLFNTGDYALLYPNKEVIHRLHTRLNEKFGNNSGYGSNEGLRVKYLQPNEENTLNLSSKYGITTSTLRTIGYPSQQTADLYYLLHDFDVVKGGIIRVDDKKHPKKSKYDGKKPSEFFIRFSSPAEAERAVLQMKGFNLHNHRVQLYWYQA